MTSIGHNSDVGGIAGDRLRSFIERIERLNEEIKGLNDDKRDIFAEAKAIGFCTKTLKRVIQRRAMEASDRQEADALLELYEAALGTGVALRAGAGE